MKFDISKRLIKDNKVVFVYEEEAFLGVKKIADKVRADFKAVFGAQPVAVNTSEFRDSAAFFSNPIFFGTYGRSRALDKLEEDKLFSSEKIRDKREVFSISIIEDFKYDGFYFESALVVAGSDKRGTIYGLFKLSEMLGVSPFVDWMDIKPVKKSAYSFEFKKPFVSKEPSVRYRGFFINDEWPAFGNFCYHNYGGFTAKVYEHVFELILRLKGNFLWPAMWSAIFPNDGPYLANAELADELGIVMGASHHEPCLRQGEEYRYLRGKNSIYGDAWDFRTNQEGITKFWRDGLKRSGKFENVITVGMRGECDTAIMGEGATLKDNIDLLRDVLRTQNRLIRENVNENLDEVPRLLALYKEVEPFFYGDENTQGLMGDEELEGVTLLLCDDNYGNLRTVPTKEMRDHKGGYGMYYHFDYHGFPISFEWFNTTYLPKVWEQMTAAYDFGIRDLWVVNVGDIFSNEYPLGFFLDLAYDFEKWGTSNINSPAEYTSLFVKKNFKDKVSEEDEKLIEELLWGYTKIAAARRTEAMNDEVFAPVAYNESELLLEKIQQLMKEAKNIRKRLTGDTEFAYYELVYLPLMANLNVIRMWLYSALNHLYAQYGSTYALLMADKVNTSIRKDRKLVSELHSIRKEKWYGMGLSEHIGFNNWCEEECRYPVVHTFEPANKPRLIVTVLSNGEHTEGGFWSGKVLNLEDFLTPETDKAVIRLTTAGEKSVGFTACSNCKHISLSAEKGEVKYKEAFDIVVTLDRKEYAKKVKKNEESETITIKAGDNTTTIKVPVNNISRSYGYYEKNTFVLGSSEAARYISIEAEHYSSKHDSATGKFEIIPGYGKTLSAVKAYPQEKTFSFGVDSPYLIYKFILPESGEYIVDLYTNPSNPCYKEKEIEIGIYVNNEASRKVNLIPEGYAIGDHQQIWSQGVLDNIRITPVNLKLSAGLNVLSISAISPGFVLEKLVIYKKDEQPPVSYFGPPETYRV